MFRCLYGSPFKKYGPFCIFAVSENYYVLYEKRTSKILFCSAQTKMRFTNIKLLYLFLLLFSQKIYWNS